MSVLLLVRAADIRTLADNTTQQAKKQKSEMATLRPGESPTSPEPCARENETGAYENPHAV
jgi:hypothetical protein